MDITIYDVWWREIMASLKTVTEKGQVLDAISHFYEEVAALAEEMREAVGNMPDNLQSGDRAVRMSEAADTLETIGEEPEMPDGAEEKLSSLTCEYALRVYPGKHRGTEGREARCGNAASQAEAAIGVINNWAGDERPDEPSEDEEIFFKAIEDWAMEVQEHIDAATGVEFPGMYR